MPTVMYTAPPRPEEAVPVPMYNAPLLPLLAVPVDNTNNPLTPFVPELAVWMSRAPDVEVALWCVEWCREVWCRVLRCGGERGGKGRRKERKARV